MLESEVTSRNPQGDSSAGQEHIVNADGQRLFCRSWVPDASPRALVFVVHGWGEHCGRYISLAQFLTKKGLLVFAHDHVGHGRSEGERMVVREFNVFIRDSLQHVDLVREQYPSLPLFILGHSMGGAISILSACKRPGDIAGVVLIAPMVQINPESATPFKMFMAKLLNHVLPSLSLGAIDSRYISRDENEVESYVTDQLNYHGGMSVAFAMHLIGAIRLIERTVHTITWPFLLLHGDADKLCDIRGSYMILDRAQSTDKQLKVYEGAYHALHHELPETRESVLRDIGEWIVKRIPAQAASRS